MKSYYDLLKDSRLDPADLYLQGRLTDEDYNNINSFRRYGEKCTININTEFQFVQLLEFYSKCEYYYYYRLFLDQCYNIHKIGDTLITEYSGVTRPTSILKINPMANLLGLAILEGLKETYRVKTLEDLKLSIDKNKSLHDVIRLIIDILNSNGGVFYGFFCSWNRWYSPINKKPIRIHKFTIQEEYIFHYITQHNVAMDTTGERIVDCNTVNLEKMLLLKYKGGVVSSSDNSWIFSLTIKHLEERISEMRRHHEQILNGEISTRLRELDKLENLLEDSNEKLNTYSNILKKFDEGDNFLDWRGE